MEELQELLTMAMDEGASDLHIVPGLPPLLRIHTTLTPAEGKNSVTPQLAKQLVHEMIGDERYAEFEKARDADFSTTVPGRGRFRVNAHFQRGTVAIAFRTIANRVPSMPELNLPPIIENLIDLPRGLILVTGETGSGKSTTLASMIETINQRANHHVITLEDPIEYELTSNKCVIEQRELGMDVPSFASGLRHALRQDPDILMVGEMRDLDTTSSAITAAETGHLVLSTLHTQNAAQTIERIVDIYPSGQQNQIRTMLANTLQAVISQTLFNRIDQSGMVPACEIMLCNAAVRNCIRENRIHELPNIIETSRSMGMCTLDDSIKALFLNGMISRQQAISQAVRPAALSQILSA